jgi:hypothetical protein
MRFRASHFLSPRLTGGARALAKVLPPASRPLPHAPSFFASNTRPFHYFPFYALLINQEYLTHFVMDDAANQVQAKKQLVATLLPLADIHENRYLPHPDSKGLRQ